MLNEFKQFAMRGNVVDLAVGLILGAAFTTIVNSFVNDILMPPLGLVQQPQRRGVFLPGLLGAGAVRHDLIGEPDHLGGVGVRRAAAARLLRHTRRSRCLP